MAFTKIAAAGIGTTETVTVDGLTVINNGSFGGNLSVGGTLTYEDVTNVDSVGLITARNGIVVGSGITLSKDGNIFTTGISTFGGNIQMGADNPEFEMNAGGPRFRVPSANTLSIFTTGGLGSTSDERVRLDSSGRLLLGTTTPGDSTADDLTIATSGSTGITIRTGTSNQGNIYFADGTSGTSQYSGLISYNHSTNHMFFGTNDGTERLRIDSNGTVVLKNTAAAVTRSDFFGSLRPISQIASTWNAYHSLTRHDAGSTYGPYLILAKNRNDAYNSNTIVQDNDELGNISFQGNDGSVFREGARIRAEVDGTPGDDDMPGTLTFATNAGSGVVERVRIDSSGRLLINTTNNSNGHISSSNLAVQGADLAIFKDSGGDNVGVSGHKLKFVTQSGSLGEIDVLSEGGGGPSGRGGAMLFYTKENNTGSAAERARITNTGLFGIGVTPSYRFHVKAGSVDQTARFDNSKTADTNINYIGVSLGNASTTGTALFGITGHSTAGSQACWIGMAGDDVAGGYGLKVFRGGNAVAMQRFAVGTQDHSGFVSGTDASMIIAYSKTHRFGLHIRPTDNDTGGGAPALFQNQAGTTIGSITANASNVAFNTSSDYRLKENDISIIDGITRLKKLRPIKFNWKTDTEKTVDGFLAHEVSSSVPEAVIGEKDAVNEDGSIKPQQLDYSKLVPLLTAALQEEIAKRESLEARLDAAGL